MYQIPSPAMACNADNMKGFIDYRMWNTRKVAADVSPSSLAANIASVARSAEGGYLVALVLNAHGYPGHLGLGSGIEETDASAFAPLKGLVDQIYIVGCGIAGFRQNKAHTGYIEGLTLCQKLSQATNAYVIAPKSGQRQTKEDRSDGIPIGYIDDYEGEVLVFYPPEGTARPFNPQVPLARRAFLGKLAGK